MNKTTKDVEITTKDVKLFVEVVAKLEESPFRKWIKQKGHETNYQLLFDKSLIKRTGLREEDLESFCLNLRLIIQNRDNMSIDCMKRYVNNLDNEFSELKNIINHATSTLHREINGKSLTQFRNDNIETTYHHVFDVLFYGGLAHKDVVKREMFETLVSSGLFSYFVFTDFISAILRYRNCYAIMGYHLYHHLVEIGEISS